MTPRSSRPLRLLVASDKFKGSLSGPAACEAIAAGFRDVFGPEAWEIRTLPVADGGEGLARALTDTRAGRWVEATAGDPLGRPVAAGVPGVAMSDGSGEPSDGARVLPMTAGREQPGHRPRPGNLPPSVQVRGRKRVPPSRLAAWPNGKAPPC